MGNKESTQSLKPKDLKELKSSTKFNEKELKAWYKDFCKVSAQGHSGHGVAPHEAPGRPHGLL